MNCIALHILDLANNSIRAKASKIDIIFCEDSHKQTIGFQINDNGIGMDAEQLRNAVDPFFTTRKHRKLGFGLAFIKMQTEISDGDFSISSEVGKGTELHAIFSSAHIDTPPIGDLAGVLAILLSSHTEIKIRFIHWNDGVKFFVGNKELEPIMEGFPKGHTAITKLIKQYINDNIITNKKLEVTT
jgi:hypothetical protein